MENSRSRDIAHAGAQRTQSGQRIAAAAVDCTGQPGGTPCVDAGSDCTTDICDGDGTCVHPNLTSGPPCDDEGDPGTVDICIDGACTHMAPSPTPSVTATPSTTPTATPTMTPPAEDSSASLGGSGLGGCSNGLDDDGDGLADCADPDCIGCGPCGVPAPAASPPWTLALALVLIGLAATLLRRPHRTQGS